jgi:PKD repeat protein
MLMFGRLSLRPLLALLVALAAALNSSAQILVAGWDFSNSVPSGNYGGQIAATHSDFTGDINYAVGTNPATARGSLYSDGSNGSQAWPEGNLGTRTINAAHSPAVNATISTLRRSTPGDELFAKNFGTGGTVHGILFRRGSSASPSDFSLVVDTRGTSGGLTVSFAAGFTGTGGNTTTITWFYAIGGGALQPTGETTAISGAALAAYSVTFNIPALNNEPNVVIVARIGAIGASNPLAIDNIQVLAPALLGGGTAPPTVTSPGNASATVGTPFSYAITSDSPPGVDVTYSLSGASALLWLSFNPATGVLSGTPTPAPTGTFNLTVRAINGAGTGMRDLVLVVSAPTIGPPVINSALTATATQGQTFNYQITATNSPTSFSAAGLPAGLSVNTATGLISGAPSVAGVFNVTLGATNAGGSDTKTLVLTVNPPAPVITSPTSATGTTGQPFSYQIVASNNPTSFSVTGLPAGLVLNPNTGAISGTPTAAGTSSVTLRATNAGGTGTATLTLVIALGLQPPVITSPTTAAATTGQLFTYQIQATNNPTSFGATGLPSGFSLNAATGVISGTPTSAGAITVTISATNAAGTGTANLSVTVTTALQPPAITSATTATAAVGQSFTYQITASNAPTSFSASGLPPGLAVDTTTGTITGAPTAGGNFAITLGATNAAGTGTAALNLTVTVPVQAPVISSATMAAATTGQPFNYLIVASNNPTSFSATGLPPGLAVNAVTGAITGSPAAAGTFTVNLGATNTGGTGTATLTLTVTDPVPPPQITSQLTAAGTLQQPFSYQITATGSPTSFAASGLPAGLSINTATGAVTGSPAATGTFSVTISATNSGGTGTATLVLTVTTLPVPQITSAAAAGAIVGEAFSFQVVATHEPASFTATNLPPGLAIAPATGLISGTPTTAGAFAVSLEATNANGTGTATLTLTVLAPPVLEVPAKLTATQGRAFTYQIVATGSPETFTAVGLPEGLVLNPATGRITGSPTTLGDFPVEITAANLAGTATAALVFTVEEPGKPPEIVSALTAAGRVGEPFVYQIQATGSPTSFATTGLPAGLSLNTATGRISGTPATAGTSNVTLRATNENGVGTATLALTILPRLQPPVITSASTAQGRVGTGFTYRIVATNNPTSFGATGLPPGLSVNVANGTVSGQPTRPGTFAVTLRATNAAGTGTATLTLVVRPGDGPIANLSSRGVTQPGERVLIAGFIVRGEEPLPVLVRVSGPELDRFGLKRLLPDPTLEIFDSTGRSLAFNAEWGRAANAAELPQIFGRVGAFPFAEGSKDAALHLPLPPGAYTAIARGGKDEGTALLEVYDAAAGAAVDARLSNTSLRGEVRSGEQILIGGLVVRGQTSQRFLIRAAGPALQAFGVSTPLSDPRLKVLRGTETIASNDQWGTGDHSVAADLLAAGVQVGAFPFASGSRDAALILTLTAGSSYTIHVEGAPGAPPGIALLEIYHLD